MTPDASDQVEIWKTIVGVQQHFNDLELRIRNFAVVLTGAVLGLGGYAIKDGGMVHIAGAQITVASLIILSSLIPLAAFYLMDRFWYHRLLDGSVKAGADAEAKLREIGLSVDLGEQISRASPFDLFWRFPVHSKHKMDGFYFLIAACIVGLAVILAEAEPSRPSPTPPQVIMVPVGAAPAAVRQATSLRSR